MIITVDIGNTNITYGIFDNDILIKKFNMPSNRNAEQSFLEKELVKNLNSFSFNAVIISSVVDELTKKVQKSFQNLYGIESIILNHNSNYGIKICVENNKTVGIDRVVNGAYAYHLYKTASIVIDLGTANTFDVVNEQGEFIGGLISPGLQTQFNSLNINTSKLPKIEYKKIDKFIAKNTETSIISGVVKGTACMINGMIEEYLKELKINTKVILTGGASEIIKEYTSFKFDLIDSDFNLYGLNYLLKLNS